MKTSIRIYGLATLMVMLLIPGLTKTSEAQVPQGFNYQAVARNAAGDPIANTTIQVRLSVLSDTNGFYFGTENPIFYVYEETHNPVKTNAFGLFTVAMGKGVYFRGSTTLFSNIAWLPGPLYIGTKIYYGSPANWKPMGTAKLYSVPYALVANSVASPLNLNKLAVINTNAVVDEALFEVRNKTGQTVFAVYNEGVRVYVDNGDTKGTKGGFAIGGFGAKASVPEFFKVTTDSIRINIDRTPSLLKGAKKGGFSISGFDQTNGIMQELMRVTSDSTRIYFDETKTKGSKGGFAIGGFNGAKGTTSELMFLSPDNYFIGHSAGQLITTGQFNSILGYQSGKNLTTASSNVFIGYMSGYSTNTGSSNVFIGNSAGYTNSTGYWNIMLGRAAGQYNLTGFANIIIGDYAGNKNTIGSQNVMIGDYAGGLNISGVKNVFVGANAGNLNTTGSNNLFMGVEAGYSNTTGFDNVSIGNLAGRSLIDGTYNVMIGSSAGYTNASGHYNTMVGYKAGEKHIGNYATLMGYLAGNSTTSGNSQTMFGYEAGQNNNGSFNTFMGVLAGGNSGTGWFNTYLGIAAGNEAPGSNNVFIGKWAGWKEAGSDKLIIENNYSDADNYNNALIYGDFTANYLKVNGQIINSVYKAPGYAADFKNTGGLASAYGVNISAGSPDGSGTYNYMIDFNSGNGTWKGSILIDNGVVKFYQVSDARQKDNITKSGINALDILSGLEVVEYNFTKSPGVKHTGYIAQDAKLVYPEMVMYNERADSYGISTISLIPVLHKAINEQQKMIEDQEKRITELEALVRKLTGK